MCNFRKFTGIVFLILFSAGILLFLLYIVGLILKEPVSTPLWYGCAAIFLSLLVYFCEDVLRRLERIEAKIDQMNSKK